MDSNRKRCSLCGTLNFPESLSCSVCDHDLPLDSLEPVVYAVVRSVEVGQGEIIRIVDNVLELGNLVNFEGCFVIKTYKSLLIADRTIQPIEAYLVSSSNRANSYKPSLIKIKERVHIKIISIPVL
jgi:hypothetical protein